MSKWNVLVSVLAILALLVGLAPVTPVRAATTLTINASTADDNNPGGGCTLREAIDLANAGAPPSSYPNGCTVKGTMGTAPVTYQINLSAYTYTLASTTNEDNNANGDLDIEANVIIMGQGTPGATVIDGGGIDRVFHIDPGSDDGSFTVQIVNTTIRNGSAGSAGGGIQVTGSNDTLYLSHTIVYANASTWNGGGIYNVGTLHITNSDVYSNTSSASTAFGGGGIYNAGTLNVTDSDVYSNTLTGSSIYGGGIYNAGTMTFSGGSISTNEARNDGGGGLANQGMASLTGVMVSGNTTPDSDGDHDGNGAGIYSWGTITLTNCTISHNQAHDYGGGVYNGIGGTATISGTTVYSNTIPDWGYAGSGIYNKDGTLNVINSAISDNWIGDWAYGGGGIYNSGGTAHVANSIVSGNDATGLNSGCGGIYNAGGGAMDITASAIVSNTDNFGGGGICNVTAGSVVTITNSTISANQTWESGGGINNSSGTINLYHVTISDNIADSNDDAHGEGGGIYSSSGTVNLEHTIVAGNTVVVSATHSAADCDGTVTSQGYNMVGQNTGCPSNVAGDHTVNPAIVFTTVLGPLADNGGDTGNGVPLLTHALLSGSPAIDAIPAAGCALTSDQRGEPRPVDGDLDGTADCDIGAYEFVPTYIYLPLVLRN